MPRSRSSDRISSDRVRSGSSRSKSRPRTKRGKSSDRHRSRSNDGGKPKRGKSSDRRHRSRSNDGGKKDSSSPRKTKKPSKQRRATTTTTTTTKYADDENPDLVELEERLTEEVDDEFFQDPRKFHTLNRIIDVLGMQLSLNDDASMASAESEECRVARQFHDAVSQVQSLRKQVKDIQETLGTGSHRNGVTFNSAGIAVNASGTPIDGNRAKDVEAREAARAAASSAMSL
eukprot:CAMPEP_0116121720 /NCGR_PEP_ID=MMETSP0329-20121206/3844_1 /TAXON_ID=697910 /ORGANISM="Pseudo-nitzschia arenysensis, Strain B593" /LENGTH=230 /DNA_ID=CAMNT_0003615545 /DNA_START=81 /DNA_END=771 /DNA_ORIENTATION=-